MMFALLFEDDDSHADMRSKFMSNHLAFLASNAKSIHGAGPLKDAGNAEPAGGLWIVEADNLQQVRLLIEADPF